MRMIVCEYFARKGWAKKNRAEPHKYHDNFSCTPLEKEREKTNDNMLTVCTSMCMNKYLAANAEYKSTGIAKCF